MSKEKQKKYCYDYPRPAVTVDIALLRREFGRVEVLLIKRGREPFKGRWALPGGFVDKDESLDHAARRELEEETGVTGVGILAQIGAFGDPGRDPRGHTVSIAFASWVEPFHEARAADDAVEAAWHRVSQLPDLAFDHELIVSAALRIMSPLRTDESP